MSKKRVRMIDVANAAGVSRTTASFALNGIRANIPEETRERVLTIAREMNYTPHAAARNLATGKTHRLGVMLSSTYFYQHLSSYHPDLLASITATASRHNQNLLLHSAIYQSWKELASDILSGVSDGVILIGREIEDELTAHLLEQGFPMVCISYVPDDPRAYAVDCDNVGGAYSAIQHLLKLGHEHILFTSMGDQYSWERERLLGVRRAFDEAGLPEQNLLCAPLAESDLDDYIQHHILPHMGKVTALFVSDELTAQHLIERLPEHHIFVPKDIAVVSFNSTEISARTRPPATSVWQPLDKIGEAAVDMLISRIEQQEMTQRVLRFATSLDIRESCGMQYQRSFD